MNSPEWLEGSRAYYAEELVQWHWCTLFNCFKVDAEAFGIRQAMIWLIRHGCFLLLPPALQEALRLLVRRIRGNSMSRNTFYWLSPQMQEVLSQRRSRTFPTHSQQVRKVGQKELLETLYNAYMGHVMEWTESLGSHSGIELRHPLNDPQLIQYAFSTLTRLRLRGSRTKYVHVQALQNFMPRIILERKSKADFSIVFREHLDQMKGRLTETLPHERSAWVNLDGMGRLFQTYRDNPQLGWPLWILWSIHGCDETFG